MNLFVRLDEIYELGLFEGRIFSMRILPLFSGSVLVFVGNTLREGNSWSECKSHLLEKYFPYFVCESLVRERIVFYFHKERQPLRQYIARVFRTAKFLNYQATEVKLVDRVVMNLHPSIFVHTALLDRQRSLKDLYRVVGLFEEKSSVARERQRVEVAPRSPANTRATPRDAPRPTPPRAGVGAMVFWGCGQTGHGRRNCPRRNTPLRNEQSPGGQQALRTGT